MASSSIIGRKKEIDRLQRIFNSDKSEFVAIYGRRRVGKSYLIDEAFKGKFAFNAVGIYIDENVRGAKPYYTEQLSHFYDSLLDYGLAPATPQPNNWQEAFRLLKLLLSKKKNKTAKRCLEHLFAVSILSFTLPLCQLTI